MKLNILEPFNGKQERKERIKKVREIYLMKEALKHGLCNNILAQWFMQS